MDPIPTGTASCIARPRIRKRRAVSAIEIDPTAAKAEYSPKECPATNDTPSRAKPSASSARTAASDVAINAGCAFTVRVRSSISPCQIMEDNFSPRASSTSSNTAFEAGYAAASACPIPMV